MIGWSIRDRIEHEWTRRRLSAYLDDDLSPAERIRLERHAHHCADCGPLLRSLALLLDELRGLARPARPSIASSVVSHLRTGDRLSTSGSDTRALAPKESPAATEG